ncbi:glycosyltransferase family 47 protein [bacterium]|nr:glycosyltransferase family 47 protein [bacterium]
MGPLKYHSDFYRLFARPTFSHLLADIVKNRNDVFEKPKKVSFGFRGYLNHKVRAMMTHVLHHSDFNKEIHINRTWSGPSKIGGTIQDQYIQTMRDNLISLCPRGSGIDSVRLIESCYYSRVPVLISDHDYYLVDEERSNTDFVFRITSQNLTPKILKEKLQEIYDTPIDELHDRADCAKKYFDNTIRKYFKDPTYYFMKWLEE